MIWTAWTIVKAASERVPNKNLRPFCGRPLVRWMLEAVEAVPEIGAIVVNTDAVELLRPLVADLPKVVLRPRPADLLDPRLDANTLLRRDVEDLPEQLGGRIVMLHATSPLLRPATIREAIAALQGSPAHDSLFGVTRRQARFFLGAEPVNHDPTELRPTQDLEPVDEENSALYLTSAEVVRTTGRRIGRTPLRFEVTPSEAVDIDGPEDWRHAELIARGRTGSPAAVLFDLDGTLIDSLPDVARALSEAVAFLGLGPYRTADMQPFIGRGSTVMVQRALKAGGQPTDNVTDLVEDFIARYRAAAGRDTKPFPGVEALLDELTERGVPMAICTNKPWATTEPTLAVLGWSDRFDLILCPDHVEPKPSPRMLLTALERLKAPRSGAVLVGDTRNDSFAAAAAGIPFVWAEYGYATSPLVGEVSVASAEELSPLLDALAAWGRPGP